ncbi:NrfD/PsrC family molybdoenzyme membrane anchor subunit [Thioalkalivibrio sp. ARh3]|uniref:NrfD/PsrC family molybdoenzyme membrane anchor subunit n=1 Tax=Thioalkalivibrio sp. ARh3 TaxID=1158148 RepID=UPI000370D1EC|nr:NrfD/PsrC family molybdoenzyme membrane anchor subunit [Thioalkalivibrio sp. ARh3]
MTAETIDRRSTGLFMPLMLVAAAIAIVTFAIAGFALMTQGHAAFNMDANVAWGLPISTYVYFALMSSGLTLVAALAMVFGFKQYYPLIKRAIWLAIITLVAGLAVLALELGHTFRMLWAIPLNMQIQSAMFWMGVFYLLDLIFMAWKFQRMERGDWSSSLSRQIGIASFVAVLLAAGTLALIFGMMSMRPFWYDPTLPVWFYATAGLSGIAALVFFTYLSYGMNTANMPKALRLDLEGPLPRLFLAMLGITLVLMLARLTTGLYANDPGVNVVWSDYLLASGWFHLALWGGLLLPFLLMLGRGLRRSAGLQMLAAILVLVGMFIERLYFVVGGQVVPLFKGTWERDLVAYAPSFTEWVLVVMGAAIVFALYALGERLFNLSDMPDQNEVEERLEREAAAAAAG